MSILAHVVHNEETLADKLLHPVTGLDHIAAMIFVAASIALVFAALRGRKAATTSGTVTRVRSRALVSASVALLAASIVTIVVI